MYGFAVGKDGFLSSYGLFTAVGLSKLKVVGFRI